MVQRTDSLVHAQRRRQRALATGSGEPPPASMAAAIANAFFDATGVRINQTPMAAERVRAMLKAAGIA